MTQIQLSFRSALLLAPLVLCLASTPLRAEDPRFPNSEDLRHIKAIGSPELSPDGKQILFTLTDSTADGAKSHIWIVPVSGGSPRQLTFSPAADKRGERAPAWAPDGSAIFFMAHRGENTQIFRLPLSGGEASPYELKVVPAVDDSKEKEFIPPVKAETKAETKSGSKAGEKADTKPEAIAINPNGFAISPDGKWLAVWAEDPETPGEKKGKEAKADAVWVNHEHHGERLYLAAFKADGSLDITGDVLKATGLAPDVHAVSWSPKSDRLLVVTDPPNDVSDLGPAASAWIVNVNAQDKPVAVKNIPATMRGSFSWKLDGSEVVFAAQTPEDAPPGVEELFALALPAAGSAVGSIDQAQPQRLLPGYKGGLGSGEAVFLAGDKPGGDKLLVPVVKGTQLGAIRLSLDGKTSVEDLPQKMPVIAGLSTNRNQTGWIWTQEAGDHAGTLCYSASLGGECQVIPIPDLTTQHFRTVPSKLVSWQNEGLTIEGLLYLPPEAEHKKVPLIIDVHGGPLGAWEDRYGEWTNFLIGHGWAILRPNPRGSSGYGVAFAAANKNDLGGKDFDDVMAGLDFAIKNYPIDTNKLALMGYSYGGEMAGFAEGKTDRFKAIISGAPVIDQFSEYGTERGSWYDRWYFGKPWEHMADAWRQSPLSGAAKAKTPFLLLQGQSDGTDPLGQAEEMYRALRQEGVPVDLVTYPREDHGPLAGGIFGRPSPEPWHGFDGRQRIVDFLQKAFGEEAK
jgi:dipeptidyl aminopeptidase/acylaminoacyl peptidase